jgi:hypothetical protein
VRENREFRKAHVPGGMIEMKMSIDQGFDSLAGSPLNGLPE